MANYEIYTDSSCDFDAGMIEKLGIKVMQLEVIIDDKPPVLNRDINIKEFYDQLREGANAKTSAVTLGFFEEAMRETLSAGKDILYLGFSSGLSAAYNNGVMVIEDLKQEFPDRKLLHLDTLCASGGQGMLVYHAVKLQEQGKSMEEVLEAIAALKDNIHHQLTVEDLFFLKRGGRISAASAIAGSMLKIKPIINVVKDGRLESMSKVRGRKASINELFNNMKATADVEKFPYVTINHSDCLEEANGLAEMVKAEFPSAEMMIGDIGPVIGAHTGPGAMLLCYLSKTEKGVNTL